MAKPPDIKIGVQLPLSGPIADYGIYCLEGIRLAFNNRPDIKLIIKDNEGKVENIPTILREFDKEKVVAVIGPIISPNALIAGLEANKLGLPIILPAATNTAITKVSNFLFRACYTDKQQAQALAKFTYSTLNKKEVYILTDTSNIYSGGLSLYFKYDFEKEGGKAHILPFVDNVSQIIDTIAKLNCSTIFLPLYYKPVIEVVKKTREKGLKVIFIGADGLDSPELFKALEQDTEKIYFSTHYFETNENEFIELYKKAYGKEPNAFTALGFDAGKIILSAIEKAKWIDRRGIFEALLNIGSFQGVTGTFQYNGKKDPIKTVFIIELKNGKPTLVQKL